MASRKNPYSNIRFESWVDWQHVDPALLQKINSIARARGEVVDVFSGYRSPEYNKKVGGAENSAHKDGQAIDAYVGGKPIGEVWPKSVFEANGLRSGNQPGFFHGKPDPEHVDTRVDGSVTSYAAPAAQEPSQQAPQQPPQITAADQIAQDVANAPIAGAAVGPNVIAPRDATTPPLEPPLAQPRYETWQMLSQLPGASPDTMRLTELASYDDAGT